MNKKVRKVRLVFFVIISLLLALLVGTILWRIGVDITTVMMVVGAVLLILWIVFMVATKLIEAAVGKKKK